MGEIEKVARAICLALGENPNGADHRNGMQLIAMRYEEAARAAIQAMRPLIHRPGFPNGFCDCATE